MEIAATSPFEVLHSWGEVDLESPMIGRKEGERKSGGWSKSAHTEAQIIGAVKAMEAGRKADEVAREIGISEHTMARMDHLARIVR